MVTGRPERPPRRSPTSRRLETLTLSTGLPRRPPFLPSRTEPLCSGLIRGPFLFFVHQAFPSRVLQYLHRWKPARLEPHGPTAMGEPPVPCDVVVVALMAIDHGPDGSAWNGIRRTGRFPAPAPHPRWNHKRPRATSRRCHPHGLPRLCLLRLHGSWRCRQTS